MTGFSSIEKFLLRLEGVRKTPQGWRAFCPAHQLPPHAGRGRTLSVTEFESGSIGVKCFAGCGADAIVAAIGLTQADLFPRQPVGEAAETSPTKKKLKGWDWWSLASALDAATETLTVALLRLADAQRANDPAAARRALVEAIGSLRGLEEEVRFGKGGAK